MLGPTVLVVEDDLVQRQQIARVLREAGYDVSEASEGIEAICLLDARKIHLVLTDIRMPCLDGISLLKYLKIFFRHIPVVVITGYPEDTKDFEPDALLCKPFGKTELIALIRRLTQGPAPWTFVSTATERVSSARKTKAAGIGKSNAYNFFLRKSERPWA